MMSEIRGTLRPEYQSTTDWWSRLFSSRGLLQLLIGTDTESLVVLTLSGALVFVITVQASSVPPGSLMWLLGMVVALFFLRNIVTQVIRLIEAIRGIRN
jgi:hypothetical protein